jgi:hypothetical protein
MSKLSNHAAKQAKSLACAKVDPQRPPNEPRLFQRGTPPTTTGQLLLEVALFAAENIAFTQQGDAGAADRARDHLMQIRELASRRLAELPSPQDDSDGDSLGYERLEAQPDANTD